MNIRDYIEQLESEFAKAGRELPRDILEKGLGLHQYARALERRLGLRPREGITDQPGHFWIHYDFDSDDVVDIREVTAEQFPSLAYLPLDPAHVPKNLRAAFGKLPKDSKFKVVEA